MGYRLGACPGLLVHKEDRFICRVVCEELAGTNLSLQEITRARRQQRKKLRGKIRDRRQMIETLLDAKHDPIDALVEAEADAAKKTEGLRRYWNDS